MAAVPSDFISVVGAFKQRPSKETAAPILVAIRASLRDVDALMQYCAPLMEVIQSSPSTVSKYLLADAADIDLFLGMFRLFAPEGRMHGPLLSFVCELFMQTASPTSVTPHCARLVERGVLPVLCGAAASYSDRAKASLHRAAIVMYILKLIALLCIQRDALAGMVPAGLKAVFAAMATYNRDSTIQLFGCSIVERVCSGSKSRAISAVKAGALFVVMAALAQASAGVLTEFVRPAAELALHALDPAFGGRLFALLSLGPERLMDHWQVDDGGDSPVA